MTKSSKIQKGFSIMFVSLLIAPFICSCFPQNTRMPPGAIDRKNSTLKEKAETPGKAGADGKATSGTLVHRFFQSGDLIAEQVQLPNEPELTVLLFYKKGLQKPMPIMLGGGGNWTKAVEQRAKNLPAVVKKPNKLDAITMPEGIHKEMVERGAVLVVFTPRPIPWEPGRPRWIWPQRNAARAEHYTQWCKVAPWDYGVVIDYMQTRKDCRPDRIGYFGFSVNAMIGTSLVAKEPRITCAALYGGSGSFRTFWGGGKKQGIWETMEDDIWPETKEKMKTEDPVLYARNVFPTALLMVNGGKDEIIPEESNKDFFNTLWPYYKDDPDRLQYVVFESAGHGWDQKWWDFMAVDWLDRYLIQETPPPARPRK